MEELKYCRRCKKERVSNKMFIECNTCINDVWNEAMKDTEFTYSNKKTTQKVENKDKVRDLRETIYKQSKEIEDLTIEKYSLKSQLEYTIKREEFLTNKLKEAKEMADLLHRKLKD